MEEKKQQREYSEIYNLFSEESEYFRNLNGWNERTALLSKLHRYETTLHRIAEEDHVLSIGENWTVRDMNGNTVGFWRVE